MKCMSIINRKPGTRLRGFSVPTAIFIIVILAALGAFMVTIGSGQQSGLAQDVTGTRVLYAARSGLDWGIYQVVNTPGSAGTYRALCNAGSTSTTLSGLSGMPGIVVLVECASRPYSEGVASLHSYQVTATACNSASCPNTTSPSAQYVERRLSALVVN